MSSRKSTQQTLLPVVLILLLLQSFLETSAFAPPSHSIHKSRPHSSAAAAKGSSRTTSLLMATSSKELRKREEGEKKARAARRKNKRKTTITSKPKSALTQRLQAATAKAKAAAIEADYANQQQQQQQQKQLGRRLLPPLKNITDHPVVMGTLSQLTKIIDQELRSASDGTATFNVHGTTNPPPGITRDSMRSLLEENQVQSERQSNRLRQGIGQHTKNNVVVRHIAVVISKPLVQDQVTLEYACRLRALAKAIQEEPDDDALSFRPSIVCFLGGTSGGNLVSDADAGYIYFKHLCAANELSLEGIDMMLEKTTLGKGALQHIVRHLRKEYIPEWYKEQRKQHSSLLLSKVQLHFTFFSCDYDLCRLNDIHYRSPQQSILRPLLLEDQEDQDFSNSRSDDSSRVQTTWSYRYCTYPYVHFKDTVTAFLGKCYLLAQELTPVLVNIRGVVDGMEFFQRDNYRVLVSIRRSFVTDMERFYQSQPSLKSTLRQYVSNSDYPLDVVLEGALLSLGRCLDLVRPAGLLIGYVPKPDWKTAEMLLENAVRQLRDACDPDHPLDPADWGKLDHHYDQPADLASTDKSIEDLAYLTNWRLVEEEEDEDEGEEDIEVEIEE